MTYVRLYRTLPEDAADIRRAVFMEEQGFADEFDEIDGRAWHIVLYEDQTPVATCRLYWDEQRQAHIVGRIAVRKAFRGRAFGVSVLREAEKQTKKQNGRRLLLAAQVQAKGFYEKQGYSTHGEVFLEEGCPHIWMYRDLEGP